MDRLSVIIPSRNEELYLNKTISNVLENAKGDIEVVTILDGWQPSERIEDKRVVYIDHKESTGQRASINEGVEVSTGNYMMKLDAHCAVGPDFDRILIRDCEYDMTMIPAMFNLDILTWQPRYFDDWNYAIKKGKLNCYMFIGWKDDRMRALYYPGKLRKELHKKEKDKPIGDTMCCMGPGFFMHTDRFWELDGCDEGHGQWGQQGVEIACKAWLSGGRLVTNKDTWFAHYFRGGGVPEGHKKGFPYHIKQQAINKARDYSEDLWLNDKWPKQERSMEWLVKKFNPPTWEGWYDIPLAWNKCEGKERIEFSGKLYQHIHRMNNLPEWKGIQILKMPTDLLNYSEVIQETKPDFIVEIGTKFGGSSLFFQDMLDLVGENGKVITIDIKEQVKNKDSRIEYIIGSSLDKDVIKKVTEMTSGKRTMLIIDGNHHRKHVKWELNKYRHIVSSGCYLVIEDCFIDRGLYGPGEARDWFLKNYHGYKQSNRCQKFIVGVCMGGWLIKK